MDPRVVPISDASYYRIPLDLIDPNPHQPRKFFDMDGLRSLAESIRKIGQLEDILVRPVEERFQIVLGERRWRACKLAQLPTINAKVREFSDEETFTISLAENVQRADLTSVEEAFAFKSYLDKGLTQEQVGAHLGKLDRRIGEKLKLLSSSFYVRYLEQQVQDLLGTNDKLKREKELLLGLRGDRVRQVKVVNEEELVARLEQGWELVTSVSNRRFVVRLDSGMDLSQERSDRS
ncbi:MAG: ParB/RepB/Spo0J family partition protein [Chloroflexi bacterium]|nr:ParB/RepB/Spo0J family partition protein [Chloroflexota bacterium]